MPLATGLGKFKGIFLDLIFPPRCLGCGSGEGFLCPSCLASLPRLPHPYCQLCGLPLKGSNLCQHCREGPPAIDGIRSILLFEGLAREALHHFKYRNLKPLSQPFGALLSEYLQSNPIPADVLVPVPLHPHRLRNRGYNQAHLLARKLSQISGLPVEKRALCKERDNPPQARATSAHERRENVKGSFSCQAAGVKGRRVLLIDDVCTTGATLEACSLALKEAGASSVWGLTLTRER